MLTKPRLPLAVVALLCLAACKSQPPREQFWAWFQAHSPELDAFEEHRDATFDELEEQLNKVKPGLKFEFGPKEKGVREFVVSADGDLELFPEVTALVNAAPKLDGWKIIAFRQRHPGLVLEVPGSGVTLDPAKVYFSHGELARKQKIDVSVYVPGYSEATKNQLGNAAFVLLDSELGEYDTETKIGAVDFAPVPEKIDAAKLKPLTELPKVVDANFAD